MRASQAPNPRAREPPPCALAADLGGHTFALVCATVNEVAVEDVSCGLHVPSAVRRGAKLAEEEEQISKLAMDVAKELGWHRHAHDGGLLGESVRARNTELLQAGLDPRAAHLGIERCHAKEQVQSAAIGQPLGVVGVTFKRRAVHQCHGRIDHLRGRLVNGRAARCGEWTTPVTRGAEAWIEFQVGIDRFGWHSLSGAPAWPDWQATSPHRDARQVFGSACPVVEHHPRKLHPINIYC